MRNHLPAILGACILVITACGDGAEEAATGDDPAADATPDEPADEPAADDEDETPVDDGSTAVGASSTDLGQVLVDGEGMTLYVFLPDDGAEPTCTGSCAEVWPPLTGPAEPGEGIDEALLDTTEHPSGTTQVTYAGWPVYLFAGDEDAGDVEGQGVEDVWYVIDPEGEPVQDETNGGGPY